MERTAVGMACITSKVNFMINRMVLNSDFKSLKKRRNILWCNEIISGFYSFSSHNCIYPIFHVILLEVVPLFLDGMSPLIMTLLVAFLEDLCFETGMCSLLLP